MAGFDMKARGYDEAMMRHTKDPIIVNTTAPSNPVSRNFWNPFDTPKIFSSPSATSMVAILATTNMSDATNI